MAESTQPTQVVYLERPPPSSAACGLAPGTHSRPPEPFCHAERLNEEPDMGKPFVRFCEGLRHNWSMAEILWHRRETRRQTENTNVTPTAPEDLSLLDKNSCSFARVVCQKPPELFTTLHRALTRLVLADHRKEQHVASALMIPLMMKMRYILRQRMVVLYK